MSAIIELRETGVRFNGADTQVQALRDVSVSVSEGELVCVLGPSGCGKTTLLNLVAGFISPTSGHVLFEGSPVREPGPDRAVVFQDASLFPWLDVAGNVEFGMRMNGRLPREERLTRRDRLLTMVGLTDFASAHPHELSGGMRQRVAIARALALQPRVLLMDEPFGALDAQTRERLQDELLEIWRRTGTTILFVTHNVAEAAYLGDRVIVLSERPGTVLRDMSTDLPRPRKRLSDRMREVELQLLDAMPDTHGAAMQDQPHAR
jgi:NitT/TauT family transport system ATP-binding protein